MDTEEEGAGRGQWWGWVKAAQGVEGHRPGSSLLAAQNVTVDEVIGAYKQACQKLNCRQIPKLLRQLQVCQVGGGGGGGGGPWGEAVSPLPPPPPQPAQGLRSGTEQERVH